MASMVERGIRWVLKLTSVPSISKNRALISLSFSIRQRYIKAHRLEPDITFFHEAPDSAGHEKIRLNEQTDFPKNNIK